MAYETNDGFATHFTARAKEGSPRYLGIRYDERGTFLSTPGNTVVCHAVPGSATAAALIEVRDALRALPFGDRFAYTPPSSYHMTVFQGVIEGRRGPDYWPRDLSPATPIEETTDYFVDRLRDMPPAKPFRMRMADVTPLGLVVTGATAADEATLRGLRDVLVEPFGYRHPDHATYTFHVTIAYIKEWLPEGAEATYLPLLAGIAKRFADKIDVLDLVGPEFCVFDDMTEFRPLLRLG